MGGEQRAKAETWKRGSQESLAGYVKKKKWMKTLSSLAAHCN